jgi:PAS domain S-box-containing protein
MSSPTHATGTRDSAPGPRAHRYGQQVYRAVFQALTEGVLVLNEAGAVASSNPSAAFILGVTSDELHGMTAYDPRWQFLWEDGSRMTSEEFPGMRAVSMGDGIQSLPMGVRRPDGSLAWLTVNALPIGELSVDGPPYRAVVTLVDVSVQMVAEGQSARQRVALRQAELLNQEIVVKVRTAQDAARDGDLERTRFLLGGVLKRALHMVSRLGAEAVVDSADPEAKDQP